MQWVRGLWMSAWLLWLVRTRVWSQPQVQRPVPPPAGVVQTAAGAAECRFPFIYRNASHSECLSDPRGLKWCGVTHDVDADKRWRYCSQSLVVLAGDNYDDDDDDDDDDDEEDDDEDDVNLLTVLDHSSKDDPCKGMKCLFGGVCKLEAAIGTAARPGVEASRLRAACECRAPFHGKNCHIVRQPCRRGMCRNGGKCVLRVREPTQQTCLCSPRFAGRYCERSRSDPCQEPNPCLNGGTCLVVARDGQRSAVACACTRLWHGLRCSLLKGDCYHGNGSDYRGTMSLTKGRSPCVHWNSPRLLRQRHNAFSVQARDSGIGGHNYCRNPDGGSKPWCYFRNKNTSKIDWAPCKLPQCHQGQQQGASRRVPPPPPPGSRGTAAPACGRTWFGALRVRVAQGRDAGIGARPWQVSVQLRTGPPDGGLPGGAPHVHRCGGALVHPCWVLTAAHCFVPRASAGEYLVRLGKRKLNTRESGAQDFNISKIVVHPGYSAVNHDADIALLRLQEVAGACATVGTLEVVPVCLPEVTEQPRVGTQCHVSGWGAATHRGTTTPVLQEAEVQIIAMDACNSSLGYGGRLTGGMLCAGNWEHEGPDACQGDSGGPLTCAAGGEEERSVLHGIVSHGHDCGKKYWPGVYTRVTAFTPWIRASIRDDGAATATSGGGAGGGAAVDSA